MSFQIQEKPSKLCDGCETYGEKCHCLCHTMPIIDGQHEILYNAGAGPQMREYDGERD